MPELNLQFLGDTPKDAQRFQYPLIVENKTNDTVCLDVFDFYALQLSNIRPGLHRCDEVVVWGQQFVVPEMEQ